MKPRNAVTRAVACGVLVLGMAHAAPAGAQDAAAFYRQYCMSCHTIGGGRLTGPDLKDVTARRDRAWLARFIQNPGAVVDSGDPYAAEIVQAARGVVMPVVPGLTPDLVGALLDLIERESSLESSQFVGVRLSDRPFTAEDVAAGRAFFTGERPLSAGGAACLACHSAGRASAIGGGRLGPDLTLVSERLGGRTGLGAWLAAPATPTMMALFGERPLQPEEIVPLLAFFDATAREGTPPASVAPLTFFLFGLGGAVAGLVVFDQVWKDRFRGVRRRLVRRRERREEP